MATVGTFDGVHLGHAKVVESVTARARESGCASVVVTFDRHPRALLDPEHCPDLVTSVEHRLLLFEKLGLDAALVLEFNEQLASMTAAEFIGQVVSGGIGAGELVLGEGALLGSDRAGADRLAAVADEAGVELAWVEPVVAGGVKASSTEIRRRILASDLEGARRLLGRHVSVLGSVVPGARRGRELGFRTANLNVHSEIRPPPGVYSAWASLGEGWMKCVLNVGPSPDQIAVYGESSAAAQVVECHIFEFDGDLYGRRMEAAFCAKLRDELAFETDGALSEQIARDVETARGQLAAAEPPPEEILS